jgi:ankyrin repeat protein
MPCACSERCDAAAQNGLTAMRLAKDDSMRAALRAADYAATAAAATAALPAALKAGNAPAVRAALEQGADKTAAVTKARPRSHAGAVCACCSGATPLGASDVTCADASAPPRLRRACCTARAQNGNTPLHCAAESGFAKVAAVLLQWGANANARNHVRRARGSAHRVERPLPLRLGCCGADAAAPSLCRPQRLGRAQQNDTPLHLAVYQGHADVAALLVQHGADVGARQKVRCAAAAAAAAAAALQGCAPRARSERCAAALPRPRRA